MKKITIITLTFNNLDKTTKPFIESLYKYTNIEDFDLIIIENASTDGTVEFLKSLSYPNLTVTYNNQNLGYSKGNNQGLKQYQNGKQTPFIGLLNNDLLFTPNWLEDSLKCFDFDNKIGMLSPRVNDYDDYVSNKQNLSKNNYLDCYKQFLSQFGEDITYNITPYFCCVIMKKEVFEKVGFLDEKFTPAYYEDDDYCFRSLYLGFKHIYVNNAFVYHNHCSSSGLLSDRNALLSRNKEYFYSKHYLGEYIYEHLKQIRKPQNKKKPNRLKRFINKFKFHKKNG